MAADDQTFRAILIAALLVLLPVMVYHRVKSQLTGEPLDRWQEGPLILFTLRPIGVAGMLGLVAYMVDPRWMAWSSMDLPVWLRWVGVGTGGMAGVLLVWTLRSLGKNLTDTVVTRRQHTLVTHGPYRWVRHPFYDTMALSMLANALTAANWFLLLTGGAVLLLIVARTRTEEANLRLRFGDVYQAYVERTGRFVPKRRR